jgi:hypothetical protein
MDTPSPTSNPTTWHEFVLAKIDQGNGVYVLLDESNPAGVYHCGQIKVWAVKSDTDEMGFYYVIDFGNGKRVCACDGFRYADHCKHTGRVPEK